MLTTGRPGERVEETGGASGTGGESGGGMKEEEVEEDTERCSERTKPGMR